MATTCVTAYSIALQELVMSKLPIAGKLLGFGWIYEASRALVIRIVGKERFE